MSRTIKFRAWDTHMKVFQIVTMEDLVMGRFRIGGQNASDRFASLIFDRFTGLHDKNGREIYEGDIVRLGLGEVIWDEEEAGFHLRWHDKRFREARGSIIQRDGGHEPIFANAKYSLEVIGNVHENPELLK